MIKTPEGKSSSAVSNLAALADEFAKGAKASGIFKTWEAVRMKRYIAVILALFLSLTASACGNDAKGEKSSSTVKDGEIIHTDSGLEEDTEPEQEQTDREEMEEDEVETNEIYIKVGESTLTAVLENNRSAKALKELLADGALAIPASNYGGFEKVCSLGTRLPSDDIQTTTRAGDICLYNDSRIVIFYASNSWDYTRLGRISDVTGSELKEILGGEETEISLSLEPFH